MTSFIAHWKNEAKKEAAIAEGEEEEDACNENLSNGNRHHGEKIQQDQTPLIQPSNFAGD